VIFKIISLDHWHVEKLWVKSFKSQTTCLYFDRTSYTLAVGLDDGKIRIFEIPSNFKFNKDVRYESNEINAHNRTVNGICMDPSLGYVYSVSSDGNFTISDRTS